MMKSLLGLLLIAMSSIYGLGEAKALPGSLDKEAAFVLLEALVEMLEEAVCNGFDARYCQM